MIKEVCVENFTDIPTVIKAGAGRIEINDNLAVGGTTVSHGVMAAAAAYTREAGVPLVAMIRPRGGDFVYTEEETAIMIGDIRTAHECGVPAVTFCAVTADGKLDTRIMSLLIEAAKPMAVVCHMGFDAITTPNRHAALDWLVDHGVVRILTHGGTLKEPISATIPALKENIEYAAGRIEILPGGGITSNNVDQITKELGVNQAHGTKIIKY
ncbi:copper homeostasis protein CutC [Lacticaseibacillus hulanensis]|uniref:copper homeostasis protein CutC n=1 Tax=Lacticaseibacillus hulanensis TaxID=2493111 RepID=UPI000FD6C25E|nr:copper homeostasis protein CutC [Lacticaseibacillus hulanensis]